MEDREFTELLGQVVRADGWTKVVEPSIIQLCKNAEAQWLSAKDDTKRQQLLGEIRVLKWVLNWPARYEVVATRLREAVKEAETAIPADPISLNTGSL